MHPFAIDDYDPLWDFGVQEFQTFQHLFPPKYSIPRVTDPVPRIPSRSMTVIHFETSAFGSLKIFDPKWIQRRLIQLRMHRSKSEHSEWLQQIAKGKKFKIPKT
jgi:hypothetical protein